MTGNVYCIVKIIEKDERIIAAVQFEIKLFNFSTGLNSSLIIFIRTYTVNCRNALDRLRVSMNIRPYLVVFGHLMDNANLICYLKFGSLKNQILRLFLPKRSSIFRSLLQFTVN